METTTPQWLGWAQMIQALSQSGLQYTQNPFDVDRYRELSRIASEMMAALTLADPEQVKIAFDSQTGYATPKLDIRGVVFKGDRLLMVRELLDEGRWTLPGGWVDINEPPSQAVEREVREEAGKIVKATKLLALFDRNLHGHPPYLFHAYKVFMLCELLGETEASPLETADATFFSLEEIPELSLARVTPDEIICMFDHHKDPHRPADFD